MMNYTNEITINLPREQVAELFSDPAQIKQWQPTFQTMKHISGEPGQAGAKSSMVYLEGKREMTLIETILVNNLPDEFTATYETAGVYNLQKNYFYAEGDKTRWVSETEFKFSGFMRIIGFFMRGAFVKQSNKIMDDFKAFAESKSV